MADPKLDEMLLDFLREQREAVRKGITLEAVYKSHETLANGLAEHRQEDRDEFRSLNDKIDTRLSSHDHRITTVEARLVGVEKDVTRVEDTGRHDIPEILKAARGFNPSGRPPKEKESAFGKLLATEAAKWVIRALILLAGAGAVELAHQIGFGSPPAHVSK